MQLAIVSVVHNFVMEMVVPCNNIITPYVPLVVLPFTHAC